MGESSILSIRIKDADLKFRDSDNNGRITVSELPGNEIRERVAQRGIQGTDAVTPALIIEMLNPSLYRVEDILPEKSAKEISSPFIPKNVRDYLAANGITDKSTPGQIADVLNKMINVPNLASIIESGGVIPEVVKDKSSPAELAKNKEKLAGIFPETLEESWKKDESAHIETADGKIFWKEKGEDTLRSLSEYSVRQISQQNMLSFENALFFSKVQLGFKESKRKSFEEYLKITGNEKRYEKVRKEIIDNLGYLERVKYFTFSAACQLLTQGRTTVLGENYPVDNPIQIDESVRKKIEDLTLISNEQLEKGFYGELDKEVEKMGPGSMRVKDIFDEIRTYLQTQECISLLGKKKSIYQLSSTDFFKLFSQTCENEKLKSLIKDFTEPNEVLKELFSMILFARNNVLIASNEFVVLTHLVTNTKAYQDLKTAYQNGDERAKSVEKKSKEAKEALKEFKSGFVRSFVKRADAAFSKVALVQPVMPSPTMTLAELLAMNAMETKMQEPTELVVFVRSGEEEAIARKKVEELLGIGSLILPGLKSSDIRYAISPSAYRRDKENPVCFKCKDGDYLVSTVMATDSKNADDINVNMVLRNMAISAYMTEYPEDNPNDIDVTNLAYGEYADKMLGRMEQKTLPNTLADVENLPAQDPEKYNIREETIDIVQYKQFGLSMIKSALIQAGYEVSGSERTGTKDPLSGRAIRTVPDNRLTASDIEAALKVFGGKSYIVKWYLQADPGSMKAFRALRDNTSLSQVQRALIEKLYYGLVDRMPTIMTEEEYSIFQGLSVAINKINDAQVTKLYAAIGSFTSQFKNGLKPEEQQTLITCAAFLRNNTTGIISLDPDYLSYMPSGIFEDKLKVKESLSILSGIVDGLHSILDIAGRKYESQYASAVRLGLRSKYDLAQQAQVDRATLPSIKMMLYEDRTIKRLSALQDTMVAIETDLKELKTKTVEYLSGKGKLQGKTPVESELIAEEFLAYVDSSEEIGDKELRDRFNVLRSQETAAKIEAREVWKYISESSIDAGLWGKMKAAYPIIQGTYSKNSDDPLMKIAAIVANTKMAQTIAYPDGSAVQKEDYVALIDKAIQKSGRPVARSSFSDSEFSKIQGLFQNANSPMLTLKQGVTSLQIEALQLAPATEYALQQALGRLASLTVDPGEDQDIRLGKLCLAALLRDLDIGKQYQINGIGNLVGLASFTRILPATVLYALSGFADRDLFSHKWSSTTTEAVKERLKKGETLSSIFQPIFDKYAMAPLQGLAPLIRESISIEIDKKGEQTRLGEGLLNHNGDGTAAYMRVSADEILAFVSLLRSTAVSLQSKSSGEVKEIIELKSQGLMLTSFELWEDNCKRLEDYAKSLKAKNDKQGIEVWSPEHYKGNGEEYLLSKMTMDYMALQRALEGKNYYEQDLTQYAFEYFSPGDFLQRSSKTDTHKITVKCYEKKLSWYEVPDYINSYTSLGSIDPKLFASLGSAVWSIGSYCKNNDLNDYTVDFFGHGIAATALQWYATIPFGIATGFAGNASDIVSGAGQGLWTLATANEPDWKRLDRGWDGLLATGFSFFEWETGRSVGVMQADSIKDRNPLILAGSLAVSYPIILGSFAISMRSLGVYLGPGWEYRLAWQLAIKAPTLTAVNLLKASTGSAPQAVKFSCDGAVAASAIPKADRANMKVQSLFTPESQGSAILVFRADVTREQINGLTDIADTETKTILQQAYDLKDKYAYHKYVFDPFLNSPFFRDIGKSYLWQRWIGNTGVHGPGMILGIPGRFAGAFSDTIRAVNNRNFEPRLSLGLESPSMCGISFNGAGANVLPAALVNSMDRSERGVADPLALRAALTPRRVTVDSATAILLEQLKGVFKPTVIEDSYNVKVSVAVNVPQNAPPGDIKINDIETKFHVQIAKSGLFETVAGSDYLRFTDKATLGQIHIEFAGAKEALAVVHNAFVSRTHVTQGIQPDVNYTVVIDRSEIDVMDKAEAGRIFKGRSALRVVLTGKEILSLNNAKSDVDFTKAVEVINTTRPVEQKIGLFPAIRDVLRRKVLATVLHSAEGVTSSAFLQREAVQHADRVGKGNATALRGASIRTVNIEHSLTAEGCKNLANGRLSVALGIYEFNAGEDIYEPETINWATEVIRNSFTGMGIERAAFFKKHGNLFKDSAMKAQLSEIFVNTEADILRFKPGIDQEKACELLGENGFMFRAKNGIEYSECVPKEYAALFSDLRQANGNLIECPENNAEVKKMLESTGTHTPQVSAVIQRLKVFLDFGRKAVGGAADPRELQRLTARMLESRPKPKFAPDVEKKLKARAAAAGGGGDAGVSTDVARQNAEGVIETLEAEVKEDARPGESSKKKFGDDFVKIGSLLVPPGSSVAPGAGGLVDVRGNAFPAATAAPAAQAPARTRPSLEIHFDAELPPAMAPAVTPENVILFDRAAPPLAAAASSEQRPLTPEPAAAPEPVKAATPIERAFDVKPQESGSANKGGRQPKDRGAGRRARARL